MEMPTNPSPPLQAGLRPPPAGAESASASSSGSNRGHGDGGDTATNSGLLAGTSGIINASSGDVGIGVVPYPQQQQQISSAGSGQDQTAAAAASMMQAQLLQAQMKVMNSDANANAMFANANAAGSMNESNSSVQDRMLESVQAQRRQQQMHASSSGSPSTSYQQGAAPIPTSSTTSSPAAASSPPNTASSEQSEMVIPRSEVRPSDVLFGRGAGVSEHVGNVHFRHLIAQRKLRYRDAANHKIKNDVAREVFDLVQGRDVRPIGADGSRLERGYVEQGWNPPGRFLRSAEEAKAGGAAKTKKDKTKKSGNDDNTLWVEVTNKRAQEKCKQALRQHKWNAVSERAVKNATVGSAMQSNALAKEMSDTRSGQTMENASAVNLGGSGTGIDGVSLPGPTLQALEAINFSAGQNFDASLSESEIVFDVDDVGFDLSNIPEPTPIAGGRVEVGQSFPVTFESTPFGSTGESSHQAGPSEPPTAMDLAKRSSSTASSLGAIDGVDKSDPLDPAYLHFLMPMIGERESMLESTLNAPQGPNTSLSLPEKVVLARRIAERLREQHEQGSTMGIQGILGISRQLGIVVDSKVPRHPSPDSVGTDLAYLGVIFHEHFSGKVISQQSSTSFTDSINASDGDDKEDDEDSAHMSQRRSKRERLRHESSISVATAEESIDRPIWINATPLHEYGLPVSLSILVSSLLFASDSSASERYESVGDCVIDLRMMESSPGRYLYDSPPDTPTETLQIPPKLYGRDRYETLLRSTISRLSNPSSPGREVLLISGTSGIGKTALAEKIGSSVADRGGYLIRGKFDQTASIAAICGAFDSYCQELVRRNDNHLQSVRTTLAQTLGPDCNALAHLIPSVALITGQPPIGSMPGGIFTNGGDLLAQLIFYFRTFIGIICHPKHPLVVYLDGLHHIDSASLQLLEMLITDPGIKSFLILGCYRSDEVMDDHPLIPKMASIQGAGIAVTTLHLQNIERSSVNELLSDTLRLPPRITRPLANVIHSKTSGNPLFVTQFIRSLVDEKFLSWSAEQRRWMWNTPTIQAKNIDDTVVGLMTSKILRLSLDVQKGLLIAACVGYQLDAAVIHLLERGMDCFDGISFREILAISEKEGLMSTVRGLSYQFSHGAIHSAAYDLKTESRDTLHLEIGRMFLEKASAAELETESVLLVTVDQLNRSPSEDMSATEKIRATELNLQAGERAICSSCHHTALLYFKLGLTYLVDEDWSGENYELCLRLYNLSMETALAIGSVDDMEEIIETILDKARTYNDKLRAYYTRMCSLGAQGQSPEAIKVGLDVVANLGEDFPRDITEEAVKVDLTKTKMLLNGIQVDAISELEEMRDEQKIQAMRFLNRMGMIAYVMANKRLLPLIAFRIVRLSLTYGVCKESPFGIAVYSLILAGFLGDAGGASRFGKLALKLADMFEARDQMARICYVLYGFVFIWTEPIQACISKNFDAIEIGLKAGDSEYAMKCAQQALRNSCQTGETLPTLAEKFQQYTAEMLRSKQLMSYKQCLAMWQGILNLMGQSEDPLVLTGSACDEEALMFDLLDSGNLNTCLSIYVVKLWLCVIFGRLEQAKIIINDHLGSVKKGIVAGLGLSFCSFNMTVVFFSLAREGGAESDDWKAKALEGFEMFRTFAANSPWNFQHHFELLSAENHFLNGENSLAAKTYEESILTAERHGFTHEAALFSERAGLFYYYMDNKPRSTDAFRKARALYLKWGATRKATDLEALC
mmetsp:Transcript_30232/g.88410  ORF Transcript_30232/g.88410 Transcript_30232/m.88410 type:complete len:1730 (+) Transcript_30232:75-5264(+)